MTIDAVVERIERIAGGDLLKNLGSLKTGTWQTASEVFAAWQAGVEVQGVNTANMGIYRLVDDKAVFELLGKEGNLLIDDKFQKDVYNSIVSNEFFFPQDAMKQHVLSAIIAKQSVTIQYSKLNIKTDYCDKNYGYIEAGEKNTDEEKKLFSAVYGADNPGNGIRIHLLRENVVKKQLKGRKDDFIVRACYFNSSQGFNANGRDFHYCTGAVRGVRRV